MDGLSFLVVVEKVERNCLLPMRESLTRKERLKSKADFARVFNKPDIKSECVGARLVAQQNHLNYNRFAVTLVRKFGNAVHRNYARRVLKEIYRGAKKNLPKGFDMVVILFPGDYGYRERKWQFNMLIQGANFAKKYK